MKLYDGYELAVDGLGTFILRYHYTSKVNTPAVKDIGYYPTLEALKKGLVKHKISLVGLDDVNKVLNAIEEIYQYIDDMKVEQEGTVC